MSEQHLMSLSSTCRVCRSDKNACEISFESETEWVLLYEFCFQITIKADDLPKNLCSECQRKIKEFADFKNLALSSEKIWKSACLTFISTVDIKLEREHEDIDHIPHHNENDGGERKFKFNECSPNDDETFDYDKASDIKLEDEPQEKASIKNAKIQVSRKAARKHGRSSKNKIITEKINKQLPEAPSFTCGLCEEVLLDTCKIKQHLSDHNLNNDLNCKICKFVGRDFADMVTHRYDHFPKEYRIHLNCYICDKKYLAKMALQFHYRSAHLNKKGGVCSHCGKQFGSYSIWRDHEKLHVTENYKCDLCGRRFLFRHALKTHMINHSEVKGYVCDICGKGFKRNSNLKLHLQTAHDSSKVTCEHCNGTFKNQKSLKAHLQRVNKEKTFQCLVCSKYFDTPNMLKRHMVWHGDERPHVCSVCGLSYKSTSQLNIHMRKHTGVMPFKCNQCTKSYPTSNQLREHMSNHSGVRRYKCAFCPKSFHHKKLMVKHCSKRHSECEF